MTAEQILERYGPVVCDFESVSKPGKRNQVRCKEGVYTCNCAGWRFRRECKHVQRAIEEGIRPEIESGADSLVIGIQNVLLQSGTAQPIYAAQFPDLAAKIAAWVRANNVLTEPVVQPAEPVKKKVRLIILQD